VLPLFVTEIGDHSLLFKIPDLVLNLHEDEASNSHEKQAQLANYRRIESNYTTRTEEKGSDKEPQAQRTHEMNH